MKIVVILAVLLVLQMVQARAASLFDIKLRDLDGRATSLAPYQGRVLLIVNVASHCGFTPQYQALEAAYQTNQDRGLVVLGFPCNQFGGQEPGSNGEIKQFCTSKYAVTFPLFDKIEVNGPNRHPLYAALAGPDSPFPGDIRWNFTKFLIGRDGRILRRFDSKVKPDAPEITTAIAAALAVRPEGTTGK
jgi:glutathione peroxidase